MTDDQLEIWVPQHALVRANDPETSQEAAASQTPEKLSNDRKAVLRVLKMKGPLCDQDIFLALTETGYNISPSGCRTRRAELVDLGLAEWTRHFVKLRSGRKSRVWCST